MKTGFSLEEVAEMLGVSVRTVYREIDRKKLGSVEVGARRVITQADLEAYLGEERAQRLIELFLQDH